VTQANLAKDVNKMKRVNRHPNLNPRAAKPPMPPNQEFSMDEQDLSPRPRRREQSPDIWGKIYALELSEHEKAQKETLEKMKRDQVEQSRQLELQLQERRDQARLKKRMEADYAFQEKQQLEKWKQEEHQKMEYQERKNRANTEMFMRSLQETNEKRERERAKTIAEEKRNVQRIKAQLAQAEKEKLKAKQAAKKEMEKIKVENAKLLEVKEQMRQKDIDFEIKIQKQYEEKLKREDEARAKALADIYSRQAYLYGKGKTTQEKIAEEQRVAEEKMLAHQREHNRLEDEKIRKKKEEASRKNREQIQGLREQQLAQAEARRRERDIDAALYHEARAQDEAAAIEAMQKEILIRDRNFAHRRLIEKQKDDDRKSKRKMKEGMNSIEQKLNAGLLKKTEEYWKYRKGLNASSTLAEAGNSIVG